MSHDQKPARMRVVKQAGPQVQRRRTDAAPAGTPDAKIPDAEAGAPVLFLSGLFLAGSVLGAIGLTLAGVFR